MRGIKKRASGEGSSEKGRRKLQEILIIPFALYNPVIKPDIMLPSNFTTSNQTHNHVNVEVSLVLQIFVV